VRAGTSYLTGSFSTTVDFDPSAANTANLVSAGNTDIFAAKYAACATADVPTVTATAASVCAGAATTLGVGAASLGGAANWTWYSTACGVDAVGTGNSITVNPTVATTYYVRAEGGCVLPASCASFNVSINANPSLSLSANAATCFGASTGSVSSSPSGATPYSYLWSTGSTSQNLTGVGIGNYTLRLTDGNGCTVSQSATVTEPTAVALSASSLPTACGSNTGSASAIASGGTGAFSFVWNNAATGANVSNLAAGNYSVTASDANGCTASAATSVGQLGGVTASIASTTPANCFGAATGSATAAAAGGQSPYSYAWTGGGNSGISATGLAAGVYTVTITDINSCASTATTTITQPTAISTSGTVTDASTGNSDGSIALQATGGTGTLSYLWSNGATTQNLTNLSANSYSVTVSDANG